ncbi:hypothetical protein J1614_004583 [Plenodomus biglobosus]|nr:hypothetical protein J1614_004583 [Plenodomus biglobosus]
MRYSTAPYYPDGRSYYAPGPAPRAEASPRQPSPPRRQHHHQYRTHRSRTPKWPPSPSVEDDADDGSRPAEDCGEGQPPANTRGTVDQESLLLDLDPPFVAPDLALEDRRFVLVSKPSTAAAAANDDGSRSPSRHWQRGRKGVAERGNLAPINTTADPPPVFTERVSTPYAYTKPQRESTAPSPSDSPARRQHKSPKSRAPTRDDAFDDSGIHVDDTTPLSTERQPARYSFVKSDLHGDDVRTTLRNASSKTSPTRRDSGQAPRTSHYDSQTQSPWSSASSLDSSSKQRTSSPKLPVPLHDFPSNTRLSSRGNDTRPTSPPSFSATVRPPSPGRIPVSETYWHATYPPVPTRGPSRPASRHGRVETMPTPAPRTHVPGPSQSRQTTPAPSLPYPVDDCSADVFMPPEEHYRFDQASITSPRQVHAESPPRYSPSVVDSPRERDAGFSFARRTADMPDVSSHATGINSHIGQPYARLENDRELDTRGRTPLDLTTPLPSCPRNTPSRHDDWYSLRGYESFAMCPTCYESSFAKTRFAGDFSQDRLYERPAERICDFSSPWIRIAWLLIINQRLRSLELLYMLADIMKVERPCPGDREVGSDWADWYGVVDYREEGEHIPNFAVCSCDKKMLEALFPSMQGSFSRLSTKYPYDQGRHDCSFRTSSRRSRTYLDLLVDLDTEARSLNRPLDVNRFIQLVRDNAYKGECCRNKALIRKPWHFIPSLPEFTVCEECYNDLIWPAMHSRVSQSTIPYLFNKTIQLVPGEDPDLGSSCCLYSPRMRRIWDMSVMEDDFSYLTRKVLERRRAESSLSRERKGIMKWMLELEKGSRQWERAKSELDRLNQEWALWE